MSLGNRPTNDFEHHQTSKLPLLYCEEYRSLTLKGPPIRPHSFRVNLSYILNLLLEKSNYHAKYVEFL